MQNAFFVHSGEQRYFQQSVRAASRWTTVRVIGFEALDACADFAELRAHYVHLSGKPDRYERDWCIGRYFLLRDHFRDNGIAAGWLLDSDFLLLAHLPDFLKSADKPSCALSIPPIRQELEYHASAHCSYWTLGALESFCADVVTRYRDQHAALIALDGARRAAGITSAISDMILLGLWARGQGAVVNLFDHVDGGLIDHNLRMDEQPTGTRLRMRFGNKKLVPRRGRLHVETCAGALVPLRGLHFQGGAKMLMPDVVMNRWATYLAKAALRSGYDRLRLGLRALRKRLK